MQQIEQKIKGILSESQYTRYQQLSLQLQGPMAVMRPDIGQKLGFLRANVELALERPDMGAEVGEMLRDVMRKYNL